MRIYAVALTVLFSVLVAAPLAGAQTTHVASSAALDAAVQQHVTSSDADRQMVQSLLDRADVKAVAAGAGIDMRTVASAVSALDPAALADVAGQARAADRALAGGQSTITISTTVLIIGLLVLILILVAD